MLIKEELFIPKLGEEKDRTESFVVQFQTGKNSKWPFDFLSVTRTSLILLQVRVKSRRGAPRLISIKGAKFFGGPTRWLFLSRK